jgi:hypothetical protein
VQAAEGFAGDANTELERLEASLKSSAAAFKQLASYIIGAANTKIHDPQSLFTLLSRFASDLDTAHQENLEADAKVQTSFRHSLSLSLSLSLPFPPRTWR